MLERLEHDGEDKEAMRHRWMMNDPKGVGLRYWLRIIVDKSIGIKRYCSQRRSSSFSPGKVLPEKEVNVILPQGKGTGEKGC